MQDARHRASLPLAGRRDGSMPAALLACARRLAVERGTVLVREGRPVHAWLVVETGALRLSCTSGCGRTATFAVLGAGDLLAPPSRGELLAEVRAMIDSVVFRVPAPDMDDAIARDPVIGSWISRAHHRQVDLLRRQLASALSPGVTNRILELLRDLASTHGAQTRDGVRIELPLSQELLATMVGATRESVNRAVRALEARGPIRRTKRGYVVLDLRGPESANR